MTSSSVKSELEDTDGYPSTSYLERSNKAYVDSKRRLPAMNGEYVPTIFSNLFRLAAFIFLRVVPLRAGAVVLPVLYVSYTIASWLCPAPIEDYSVERPGRLGTAAQKQVRLRVTPAPNSLKDDLRILLLSLPTPAIRLRKTNFLVNTLLLSAAIHFVVQPFFDTAADVTFTRVGAVYPDAVKIVARYPETNSTEHRVRVVWRETRSTNDKWRNGPVLKLDEENDWVNTGELTGLWPSTGYEYKLSSINKTHLPYPATPIQFRTFPDPRLPSGNHFRFVVSSGVTPNFPYMPFQSRTIKGFDLLAKYLFPKTLSSTQKVKHSENQSVELANSTTPHVDIIADTPNTTPNAEFLMLLGNFVEPEITSHSREEYRKYYRRNYGTTYRKVYERLPVFHTYDFIGQDNSSTALNTNASEAFKAYIADANYGSSTKGHNYYNFRYGDVAFFVLDTHEPKIDEDGSTVTMLGDKQLGALNNWLARANSTSTFKFIVSSVPLTSLLGGTNPKDSWTAFASEKATLLGALHSVPNVIILSGDRHEFAAVEFNSEVFDNTVMELSTSPLSNYYIPFWRSLRRRSAESIKRTKIEVKTTKDGVEDIVTSVEEIPKERMFKYIVLGNYKWSTLEIDTRDLEKPTLRLEVVVGGSPAYQLDIVGTPVKLHSSSAIGAFVPGSLISMFDKLGMKPKKWF